MSNNTNLFPLHREDLKIGKYYVSNLGIIFKPILITSQGYYSYFIDKQEKFKISSCNNGAKSFREATSGEKSRLDSLIEHYYKSEPEVGDVVHHKNKLTLDNGELMLREIYEIEPYLNKRYANLVDSRNRMSGTNCWKLENCVRVKTEKVLLEYQLLDSYLEKKGDSYLKDYTYQIKSRSSTGGDAINSISNEVSRPSTTDTIPNRGKAIKARRKSSKITSSKRLVGDKVSVVTRRGRIREIKIISTLISSGNR